MRILDTIINRLRQRDVRQNETVQEPCAAKDKYSALPPARFLVLADLHRISPPEWEMFESAAARGADALLMLGDISTDDMRRAIHICEGIPALYVLGNHDRWEDYKDGIPGAEHLDGKIREIRDVRIAGLSGAPVYKDPDVWCMRDQEKAAEVSEGLAQADVLISHESPYHYMGTRSTHCGYEAISRYIRTFSPSMHIFGHHHDPHEGWYHGTKEVCVFKCALIRTDDGTVEQIF